MTNERGGFDSTPPVNRFFKVLGDPTEKDAKTYLLPNHPSLAGCWLTDRSLSRGALHRDFVQADVLDGGPDNRQATVLGREDINLIGRWCTLLKRLSIALVV